MKRIYQVSEGRVTDVTPPQPDTPMKVCKACTLPLPHTEEFFKRKLSGHKRGTRGARSSKGWSNVCRTCERTKVAKRIVEHNRSGDT